MGVTFFGYRTDLPVAVDCVAEGGMAETTDVVVKHDIDAAGSDIVEFETVGDDEDDDTSMLKDSDSKRGCCNDVGTVDVGDMGAADDDGTAVSDGLCNGSLLADTGDLFIKKT